MRIGLFGQMPFGAAVYERLKEQGHTLVGVYGPAEKSRPDPLAEAARRDGVALVQPARWQRKGVVDEPAFEAYAATGPELNVMAFVTQIIPARVLEHPPQQTIQYHPSLLPKHRGRSAINHALLAGDAETGLTIFWVDEGIDTGPVLLQKRFPIGENDTVNSLYREHFFPQGVDALAEAVGLVVTGAAPRVVQDESAATYDAPWEGDAARIDWTRPVGEVHNLIRGSDRQPGAWTTAGGATVKLYGSALADGSAAPGTVTAAGPEGVTIACAGGAVRVDTATPDGAKRGSARDWAAGAGVTASTVLGS
ncbi:MAG: formyltransferase family protein [Vicinamibacterales bacterium]|jgi:methionyl-tRNA formyltransferase|nr:methionyl-tRNA formyltransferase [Acidobacteriota bacterium]MDP7295240.1 formyltransferase family protein [Vicinamibacterales bacterium]MDP7472152.1 formyltransferase family protein [Vicinamibacterales bacterium]MDP7673050.1 formyltransferase family protein [Vicinamibacterales bacterium]HJO38473.1 formyltransferase family protein [Vicinamibacterales bacterium]